MIRVHDVILSEDIATAKFACDITRCKGACCVIGDAGAPVNKEEIAVLNKAYRVLKEQLSDKAVNAVEEDGVVLGSDDTGYEINCVDSGECIFVQKDKNNVATCAIQNAYYRGELNWEKPISCHLYPIRLKHIGGFEYANYEYEPDLCASACDNGNQNGIYLADFLKKSLTRRYGEKWYADFQNACREFRADLT